MFSNTECISRLFYLSVVLVSFITFELIGTILTVVFLRSDFLFSPPVSECALDCPKALLGDGSCDKSCDNEECEFDGGDCSATTGDEGEDEGTDEVQQPVELTMPDPGIYICWISFRIYRTDTDSVAVICS
jgi:hypothetical protein